MRGMAPVTLAVIGDYPPYDIYQDGQASGIANDMAKALFERLDISVRFRQMPFKRALRTLKAGKVDALVGLGKNREREGYVLYPDHPLAVTQVAFFVRRGSAIGYRGDLREMSDFTIGTVHGFMYSQAFKTLAELGILRLEESATVRSNIQKLLRKRYDVFIANSAVVLYEAKQLGVSRQLEELSPPVDTGYMYLGISKESRLASSIEQINDALIAIRDDATEARILARYKE